jgi:hypothetical protein
MNHIIISDTEFQIRTEHHIDADQLDTILHSFHKVNERHHVTERHNNWQQTMVGIVTVLAIFSTVFTITYAITSNQTPQQETSCNV